MADRRIRLALLGLAGGAALPLALFLPGRLARSRPIRSLAQSPDPTVRALASLHQPFVETAWSLGHPEDPDESLAEFVKSHEPLSEARRTLYLQPLGTQRREDRKLVEETAALLKPWFGSPVRVLPPLSRPRSASALADERSCPGAARDAVAHGLSIERGSLAAPSRRRRRGSGRSRRRCNAG